MPRSKYCGVSWNKRDQKWQAQRCSKGKFYFGGKFSSELDAAKKSDELARKHLGVVATLNFPTPSERKKMKKNKKSTYVGVSWTNTFGKWEVRRSANGKSHFGGLFSNELEAARKSDELAKEIGNTRKLNFPESEEEQKGKSRKWKKASNQKSRKRKRATSPKRKTKVPQKRRKRKRLIKQKIVDSTPEPEVSKPVGGVKQPVAPKRTPPKGLQEENDDLKQEVHQRIKQIKGLLNKTSGN